MKIYLEPGNKIEDLVNMLEEISPGVVKARLVLEVECADKGVAMLLQKLDALPEATPKPKKPGTSSHRGPYAKTRAQIAAAGALPDQD